MQFEFPETVETIEAVPEDFRGLYAEDGEAFKLRTDSESASAVKAVLRLNGALKASRNETKALKGERVDLSPLQTYGATPEEILENFNNQLVEARESSKGGADLQKKIDKIRGELQESHKRELTAKEQRIELLTSKLHNTLVTERVHAALAEAGAVDPELASPHIVKQMRVVEDDGEFNVQVVDPSGDVRYSTASGNPMTIQEVVAEMKGEKRYSPLFKSETKSGGGSPTLRGKTPLNQRDTSEMSPTEKIKAGLASRRNG